MEAKLQLPVLSSWNRRKTWTCTVSYEVLDAFDESFDTDQDDILNRLANIKTRNQINFNDQAERVYAVTKLIEKKEKITLNPQRRSVRELVNRSSVKTLKDGVDVLYFRSKKGMEKSGLQITKRGKTSAPVYANKNSSAFEEYRDLINRIKEESQENPDRSLSAGKEPTTSQSYEDEESDNFPMIETKIERPHIQGLTPEENRELEGVLNPPDSVDQQSRIGDNGALQIQADYIQETLDRTIEQTDNTDNPEEFIELEERIIALREARTRSLQQRQLEEVREQQEEDVSRLQRFKEWAKENLLGLSAITITVAGIITTVVIGARKAIVKGAQAVGKFAKALANLGKKLGPILAPLFNIIAGHVSLGAKGLAWLASNLWVLAIAVAWLIYDYSKERRRKK